MNFDKLLEKISKDKRVSHTGESLDKAAEEINEASKRMQQRRQNFNREVRNGSRKTTRRFSI